jgi:GDPmannose 4,6-dehydratase
MKMADNPTALVTGITGQDGSYLADELVRQRGWIVHGIVRGEVDSHGQLPEAVSLHSGD